MKNKIIVLIWITSALLTACASITEQISTAVVVQSPVITNTVQANLTETPILTTTPTSTATAVVSPTPTTDVALLATQEAVLIPGYKPQAWTIYSISEIGLNPPVNKFPDLEIYDIAEDQNGVMWFATTYGLVRFDGQKWQLIEKEKEERLTKTAYVEISSDGAIWFTLYDGIYRLEDGTIQLMLDFNELNINLESVWDMSGLEIGADNTIWVQLMGTYWHFDEDKWFNVELKRDELPFAIQRIFRDKKEGR